MNTIFASKAKFHILQFLFAYENKSYLREIASMTDIPVRSVQLALNSLARDGILKKSKVKNRTYYEINNSFIHRKIVSDFFSSLTDFEIERRSKKYSNIAPHAINFVSEFYDMIQKARH